MAIEYDIIKTLLPFHRLQRTNNVKINPNEIDRDVIVKACRQGVTIKVERTARKKRTLAGWRFTPIGDAFFTLYQQYDELAEQLKNKDKDLSELRAKLKQDDSEETKAALSLAKATEELGPMVIQILAQQVDEPETIAQMRKILISMLHLGRVRARKKQK